MCFEDQNSGKEISRAILGTITVEYKTKGFNQTKMEKFILS